MASKVLFHVQVMMNAYGYEDPYSGPANAAPDWKWLFLRPFFMFNGELFLDSLQENSVKDKNFVTLYFGFILFIMFFGNALLLNLVIAIFGTIYSEVGC